jgi:hypothetical protein
MLFIEHKYISLLSNRLQRFTKLNEKSYNFRCPICGDSQKNTYKARGYLYQKKDKFLFFCHNCGASMLFGSFLKQIDPNLHNEYVQEQFLNKERPANTEPDITKITHPKFRIDSPLKFLKKVSQLTPDHPVKQYVMKRRIPPIYHHKLCYAPKFKQWINNVLPGKFNGDAGDEPRLVIPFIDKESNCFGIQGRAFNPNSIRYITIMFDEDKPKVFGLDTVDFNQEVFVLEGPIDSMFIPNAIAMAGADLTLQTNSKLTFIFDNEPRNKQIVSRMEKAIDKGYNIVIWPDDVMAKDINDMVLIGLDPMKIINKNIFSGLGARARLSQWSKA